MPSFRLSSAMLRSSPHKATSSSTCAAPGTVEVFPTERMSLEPAGADSVAEGRVVLAGPPADVVKRGVDGLHMRAGV